MDDHPGVDDRGLRLACRYLRPVTLFVEVDGELDAFTAPGLRAYLLEHTAAGSAWLVLDLSQVTFISSAGLQVLLDVVTSPNGVRGKLQLVGVTGNRFVERLLEVTGLIERFSIHTDSPELLRGSKIHSPHFAANSGHYAPRSAPVSR